MLNLLSALISRKSSGYDPYYLDIKWGDLGILWVSCERELISWIFIYCMERRYQFYFMGTFSWIQRTLLVLKKASHNEAMNTDRQRWHFLGLIVLIEALKGGGHSRDPISTWRCPVKYWLRRTPRTEPLRWRPDIRWWGYWLKIGRRSTREQNRYADFNGTILVIWNPCRRRGSHWLWPGSAVKISKTKLQIGRWTRQPLRIGCLGSQWRLGFCRQAEKMPFFFVLKMTQKELAPILTKDTGLILRVLDEQIDPEGFFFFTLRTTMQRQGFCTRLIP